MLHVQVELDLYAFDKACPAVIVCKCSTAVLSELFCGVASHLAKLVI